MELTNRELGYAIGVSPSMASRIRNGERLPSVKVLVALSDRFSIRLGHLTDAHARGPKFFGECVRHALDERKKP